MLVDPNTEIELLKQYYPRGGVWNNINDNTSELYALIKALGLANFFFRKYQAKTYQELNIYQVDEFLEEWENFVGIPDEFLEVTDNKEDRIKNVIFKIIGLKCKTIPEIKNVIKIMYGIDIDIYKKTENIKFDYTFPVFLSGGVLDNLKTIIRVYQDTQKETFDYTFDFILGGAEFIEKLILSLVPFDKANFIQFIYNNS